MKQIVLKRMELHNFRGANRVTDFNESQTIISGWNGSGKTRHFDAFCWCLFGKDSKDRKDYEVKTRENGKTLQKTDAEVTLHLIVDGQPVKLTRTLHEQWVKPHGQENEVFKGNTTLCAIDDVPMKVTDFNIRIADILQDELFKMLTNPEYFCTMPWQTMRDMLMSIAGEITDDQVAQTPEYKALLASLNGMKMWDYKAKIAEEKRKAKEQLKEIQPKIDQTQKLKPEVKDWNVLEMMKEEQMRIIKQIDARLTDKAEDDRIRFEELNSYKHKVEELKSKQRMAVLKAQSAENESHQDALQEWQRLSRDSENLHRQILNQQYVETQALKDLDRSTLKLTEYKEKRTALLAKYNQVADLEYMESDRCKYCGQRLPESQLSEARGKFDEQIERQLREITNEGRENNENIKRCESEIAIHREESNNASAELKRLNQQYENTLELLNATPKPQPRQIEPESIKEWRDCQEVIEKIQRLIATFDTSSTDEERETLNQRKREAREDIARLDKQLQDRETIKRYDAEVERLEQLGRELSAQIAEIEKTEYTINSYTRDKIAMVENRVNQLFTKVRFQMFDYTIEGNETEVCIPIVNGVQYGSANQADRIMAGFDIAQTLSRHFSVLAPIFVDNAEALSEYPEMPNQMIYLEVSRDMATRGELTIR